MNKRQLFTLMEGLFTVLVVNDQHRKAVPGRKTAIKDAEWTAELLQHGLLKASFIPSRPQRELLDLRRYRTTLTQERNRLINRLHKLLEEANLKLASVLTHLLGKTGRAILAGLARGVTDAEQLADLWLAYVPTKREALARALCDRINEGGTLLAQRYRQRTPAMAAGRTPRRWTAREARSCPLPKVSA